MIFTSLSLLLIAGLTRNAAQPPPIDEIKKVDTPPPLFNGRGGGSYIDFPGATGSTGDCFKDFPYLKVS